MTVENEYRLVPVVPTKEMMLNGSACQHHDHDDLSCIQRDMRRGIWEKMIAAAPTPPAGGEIDNSPDGVKLEVFEIVCKERDALKAEVARLATENSEIESAAITYIEDMQEAQHENERLTELFKVGMMLDGNMRVYGDWQSIRKAQEILAERDALQSDLTKARELLADIIAGSGTSPGANKRYGAIREFMKGKQSVVASPLYKMGNCMACGRDLIVCQCADQSAPATNTSGKAHCPHCGICHTSEETCDEAKARIASLAPRCPDCGYTEQDCREQMDHHLCGLPDPAPAAKDGE